MGLKIRDCISAITDIFRLFSPRGVAGFFSRDEFNALKEDVDFFSLMTYDYSSPQRPGEKRCRTAPGLDE